MLRASQKAAKAKATRLTPAITNRTFVRRSNGARASASERDSTATISVSPTLDISIRRVTTSVVRRVPSDTVLMTSVQRPPACTDNVTARPVMSANSCAAFRSISKPMAIQATGSGLRTATVTIW